MENAVAIIVNSQVMLATMKKVLGLLVPKDIKIKIFDQSKGLLDAILAGQICGVITLSTTKLPKGSTEGTLRHELKNRPGYNVAKAAQFPLPPAVEINPPPSLPEILVAIMKMAQGDFSPVSAEAFDLAVFLPNLCSKMISPAKELTITIVDDQPDEVEGLSEILAAWPKIKMVNLLGEPESPSNLAEQIMAINPDIVLLDEAIGKVRGTAVANSLEQKGFKGLKASITGGNKPDFTDFHFGSKTRVTKSQEAAIRLIDFMNSLLTKF